MNWTQRDGAPVRIAARAQITGGYRWAGSPLGPYRFDGVQFALYAVSSPDIRLPYYDVESLVNDKKNGLWIGFRLGGINHLAANGTVTNSNRRNHEGPGEVQELVVGANGSVRALGAGKLITLQKGRWDNSGAVHGITPDKLDTSFFGHEGNLWTSPLSRVVVLGTYNSDCEQYQMSSFAVVDFAERPDGQLWGTDGWRSVHPLNDHPLEADIPTRGLVRLAVEPSGRTWITQDNRGVSHIDRFRPDDVAKEYTAPELSEAILKVKDENICGGRSLGLERFKPSMMQALTGLGLEHCPALGATPKAALRVATHGHQLLQMCDSPTVPVREQVGSSPIVPGDPDLLLLVDPVPHDLVLIDRGQTDRTPDSPETRLIVAESIGLTLNGSPLVNFLAIGLWRYNGAWPLIANAAIADDDALGIFRDPKNMVWLGFADSRIVAHDSVGYRLISFSEGWNIGNLLTFARVRGNVAAYLEGSSFHKIQLWYRVAVRVVTGIVDDKAHDLWFNARAGIVRISDDELGKTARHSGMPVAFDERDGLAGSATQFKPIPSAVIAPGGNLVFSTDGNVFIRDPVSIAFHSSTPNILLQTAFVNYVGNRRWAFHRRLWPGNYTRRVSATTGDSVWSELASSLHLSLTPAFYETTWFYLICFLFAVSLLYLAHLVHLQYVTSRLEDRLHQRSSERILVAQELHDTLLQSIHGLMLRFHFAAEKLPEDEPARHALRLALSRADEVIVEGRERVQSLREEVLKETDFAEQIGAMALRLDVQQLLSFRITEDGKPKNLRADVRSELCMVAREALTNVIRHSRAARAEISLVYGEREFTMRCCDNGVGMAQSTVKQGSRDQHCGLVDIRERTLAISGTLEVWSSPSSGTEIEIRVPSRRAYLRVSTPFRWIYRKPG